MNSYKNIMDKDPEKKLTTDEINLSETIEAQKIESFGGIDENTIWKKDRVLTSVLKNIVEKIIDYYPSYTLQTDIPKYIADGRTYSRIYNFIYDPGKYSEFCLNRNTNCQLKNKSAILENLSTNYIETIPIINDSILLNLNNEDNYKFSYSYEYSDGNIPEFDDSDEDYKKSRRIIGKKIIKNYIISRKPAIFYGSFKNDFININDVFLNCDYSCDYNNLSNIQYQNKIYDKFIYIIIPQQFKYKLKVIFNAFIDSIDSICTGLDYSDLFKVQENIIFNGKKYTVYKFESIDRFVQSNKFTIILH